MSKNNESFEMYLETIYLLERDKGHAHGVEIAEQLGVSRASVTKAMNNLKKKGFIEHESYGSITLTGKGKTFSEKVYRNHKMLTLFLKHVLDISEQEASGNACRMEHVLSDELIKAIHHYLENHNIKIVI